jgi:quinol monooxygenase YgiN
MSRSRASAANLLNRKHDGRSPLFPARGTTAAPVTLMVRLTVTVSASSQRYVQDLLEAFRFLMLGTRLQPGCRECSVWVDRESTVHYIEEFETEADMQRRVRSSKFTSLLGVIESAHQPPLVQFDFVTSTRGLEYVSQVRNNPLN